MKHRKHHHQKQHEELKPSKISIFVKNEINIPNSNTQKQETTTNNETSDSGCSSCFKGLFKAFSCS